MRVLIIEDNADIAASIYDYLEDRGHTMDAAPDGVTGLHLAATQEFDVIVLDLGLPGIDGLDVCTRLREDAHRTTPILILTARDSLADKLAGFDSGADDYLVKPFALEELDARLRALQTRSSGRQNKTIQVGDLVLNNALHEVTRAGTVINLNPTCYKILAHLMTHSNRVVSKAEIEHLLWGDEPPDSDALRTHLSNLRNAVDKPFDSPLLHTIRGFGYRLADTNAIAADT